MKVECELQNSRLILVFDYVKAIYIKGTFENSFFLVNYMDFWGRDDMSNKEKEIGMKAIDKFNRTNNTNIKIVDY